MQVLLAPVPCVHLESAASVPNLCNHVAFGTSRQGFRQMIPLGIPVFIYASQPPHHLFKGGVASWTGTLLEIIDAVERGPRSGKHPNPTFRPPTAEATDGPFLAFWEVIGLHQIQSPRALGDFAKTGGGKPFDGMAPQWPVLAELEE
jgi:hypothetical protein